MDRLKDINVQRIIEYHNLEDDRRPITQMEVYGEQLDGTPVWILLHINPNVKPEVRTYERDDV